MTVLTGAAIRSRGIFTPFCESTIHEASGLRYGVHSMSYRIRTRRALELSVSGSARTLSLEGLDMPEDLMGVVMSLEASGVHVSGSVVHPGWAGPVPLIVSNLEGRPLSIPAESPIAQVVIHTVTGEDAQLVHTPPEATAAHLSRARELPVPLDIAAFIERRVALSPYSSAGVQVTDLYEAYCDWAVKSDITPADLSLFSEAFAAAVSIQKKRVAGLTRYSNIKLLS